MRIMIVSDAAETQVNGVVNTLKSTLQCLQRQGHEVTILATQEMQTFSLPTYPGLRLAYRPYPKVANAIDSYAPDCIHIATEGPMGLAARRYCINNAYSFTTSFHARYPEYIRTLLMLPNGLTYRWLQWFHAPSKSVMVPTNSMRHTLEAQGFRNLVVWGRGVDTECFQPRQRDHISGQRPLYLYVGRIAVEKNIEAFLHMRLPGTKWVIGDGPLREIYEERYPDVRFLGTRPHDKLADYYNCADVLVLPSRTDTFGLVQLEAMACGIPVAAHPAHAPSDVIVHGKSGMMDENLERACFNALQLKRDDVRQCALAYSWESATRQFLQNLVPVQTAKKLQHIPSPLQIKNSHKQ